MEATTLERTYLVLKKSVPKIVNLTEPIYNIDDCRFKVFHSYSLPLQLRFTFFDEQDRPSVYQVLDLTDGQFFKLYGVSSDKNKTFSKVELNSDVDVLLHLRIDKVTEETTKSFSLN